MPGEENPSILLRKFAGLKNTVSDNSLGQDELQRAKNVDLDDVGQLRRRRGYRQFGSWDVPCHSLYESDDGRIFVAAQLQDGLWHLVEVLPDGVSMRGGLGDAVGADPICYDQIGSTVYFSSASVAGKLDLSDPNAIAYLPWGGGADIWLSPVVNPTAGLPAIRGKLLGKPPLAQCITAFNGRMYLGQGRTVWSTELYDYDHVDKTKGYMQFEGEITMLGTVTDGVYVGTTEGVWFLEAITHYVKDHKRIRVMDSGVIPGSMVYVPAELANPPQVPLNQDTPTKESILFLTHHGYCGGQDGGVCYNYTESKFIFPDATSAAAFFRRQDGVNTYVAVTNSGGTPTSDARIGDYVDAEIIRGGGKWSTLEDKIVFGDVAEAVIA